MIFQEPMTALNPTIRIEGADEKKHYSFTQICPRRTRTESAESIGGMSELYDPVELRKKYPHELSGGIASRRVMIAASIVLSPPAVDRR